MSTALQTAPHRRQTWHQAFDAQMGLWRWMRTDPGREWMFESYRIAARDLNEGNREMIGKLYSSEESKLLGADPVFVSAGHWRNQWYPSGPLTYGLIQIWRWTRPDDAPLVVRPRRVYTWTR